MENSEIEETFIPLARFPWFEISDYGNVRNSRTGHVRKLEEKPGNRYKYTKFRVNGKKKNFYIHRLVAETFCYRPRPFKDYNYVNHKSLDRHDNHYENLEWVSAARNIQHYFQTRGTLPPVPHYLIPKDMKGKISLATAKSIVSRYVHDDARRNVIHNELDKEYARELENALEASESRNLPSDAQ